MNTEACADCHDEIFHDAGTTAAIAAAQPAAGAAADQAANPELIVAEQARARRTIQASAISLGVGIGIGAMAGIIFMLAVGLLIHRPWRGKS